MDHIAANIQKITEPRNDYKEGTQEVQLSVLDEDDVLGHLESTQPLQKNMSTPQIMFYA